jgi:tetratricopeptide (TPR) repeat protein
MNNNCTNKETGELKPVQTDITSSLHSSAAHVALLTFVALVIYSNTFQVPFLFDDEGSILLNTGVHGLSNFISGGYNFLPNRVVAYLTFAINYHFGGLNVVGYHLANLLIHTFNSVLAYYLVRVTFRTPLLKNSFSESRIRVFALTVALLFVSHPIQTQAVTYIVQRLTSLSTLFYLAALLCYAQWRLNREESAALFTLKASPWYALSLISTVLAMKTKEIAFTLPFIILLYECSFFGLVKRKLLVKITPLLLTLAIIPYTIYTKVNPLIQSGGSLLSDVNTPAFNIVKVTHGEYIYTQFNVIRTYLRLLILPARQNLDYDYPISGSLFEAHTALSLMVLLSLVVLGLYSFVKAAPETRNSDRDSSVVQTKTLFRLAAFGIFWFFITLSVESSIIIIQDVISEHRVYLPSYGFFLTVTAFAALGFIRLKPYFRNVPKMASPLVAAIILILAGTTYARNAVWVSWNSIWSDVVTKSPNKPRAHNVLGIGYFYDLKFDEAMREYQEAVRLRPDFIEAYVNMGLIYKARKQFAESISTYHKILSISAYNAQHFANMYNEIGMSYAEMGEVDQSVSAFAAAVKHVPDSTEFRNNYAFALTLRGNMDAALHEYRAALAIDPANIYALEAIQEMEIQKTGGGKQTTNPFSVPDKKQPLQ